MNASELRHRVTIERYSEGERDDDGFMSPALWKPYQTVWAKITPLSARDLIAAQAEQSEVTARMMIRYRTDIDTTMRVKHRDKTYSIASQALADNESGLEYVTFLLGSGVEHGTN